MNIPDAITHQARAGRRSWLGYARILRSIHDGKTTTVEIAQANAMRTEAMRDLLRRMLFLRLIHINGSVTAKNRLQVPCWAVGPGDDGAAFPSNAPLRPNLELTIFAAMLRALREHPQTGRQVAEACGLTRQRVCEFLRDCDRELRMVYIARYARSRAAPGGAPAAAYAFGFDMPNAERPSALTPKEQNARSYWAKVARRRQRERLMALVPQSSIFRLAA